jgi:Protein of unknown function (DUF1488)
MPLTRGRVVGYDANRMIFTFTMMDKGGHTVECEISSAALTDLDGKRRAPAEEKEMQFLAHRGAIEQIASDMFDRGPALPGHIIRIFAKHIERD